MPKRLLFIINPVAGRGLIRTQLCSIVETFVGAGFQTEVHTTRFSGDGRDAVARRGADFDYIVCCGGDGTLNETVSGILACGGGPVLGYIPAGTVNDFAYSFGLSRDMKKAAETVVSGRIVPCDIGLFGDKIFTYTAAFGAFTDVAYQTPQMRKRTLGRLAYLLEGAKRIPNLPLCHMRVRSEGVLIEDDFLFGMVTNALSIGGFRGICGRDVAMDDGLFEVSLIRYTKSLLVLQQVVDALLHNRELPEHIVSFKTARLDVESDSVPWTVDGEFGGAPKSACLINSRHAIRVVRGEENAQTADRRTL